MKNLEECKYIDNIRCNIIHEKIKNSYIQVKDGNVIVKVPMYATNLYIEKIVVERKNWILKKLEEQKNAKSTEYKNGSTIYVLGKPYTLKIIYTENKLSKIYQDNKFLYCELGNPNNVKISPEVEELNIKKLVGKYYKYIATQEVPPVMEDIEKRTGLYPQEYSIKNLKATWGICSSKKKISINQNLIAYSRHAIEYVCLHEICHLKYMNHSKEFWNLVEYYMPDYKLAKKELKS